MNKSPRSKRFPTIDQFADQAKKLNNRIELNAIFPGYRAFLETLPSETDSDRKLRLDQEAWDDIYAWDDARKEDDETDLYFEFFNEEQLFRTSPTERIRARDVDYLAFRDAHEWKATLKKNADDAYERGSRRRLFILQSWDVSKHHTLPDVLKAIK
jgi:hypothetical protein